MAYKNVIIDMDVLHPEGYDLKLNMEYFINEMCTKMENCALDVTYKLEVKEL